MPWCNLRWVKLNAHHIKKLSINEHLRLDIDNWITLCESCQIKRNIKKNTLKVYS